MNSIKRIRIDKKITQEELASKLDSSQSVISDWENNVFMPSTKNAIKLAEILECSVEDLFKETILKDERASE